jgi:hypothetical protein
MTRTASLLSAKKALIDARRAERITELKHHDPGCFLCGDGPTDGVTLRMLERDHINMAAEMVCASCFPIVDLENDFADLPLVWNPITEAAR